MITFAAAENNGELWKVVIGVVIYFGFQAYSLIKGRQKKLEAQNRVRAANTSESPRQPPPRQPPPRPLATQIARVAAQIAQKPPKPIRATVKKWPTTFSRRQSKTAVPPELPTLQPILQNAIAQATAAPPTVRKVAAIPENSPLRGRLTAANLRQQIVLYEILSPPVALRE